MFGHQRFELRNILKDGYAEVTAARARAVAKQRCWFTRLHKGCPSGVKKQCVESVKGKIVLQFLMYNIKVSDPGKL